MSQAELLQQVSRSFHRVLLALIHDAVKRATIVTIQDDLLWHVNVKIGDVLNGLDGNRIVSLLVLSLTDALVADQLLLNSEVTLVAVVLSAAWDALHVLLICELEAHVVAVSSRRVLRSVPRGCLHHCGHVWINKKPSLVVNLVVKL